MGLTLAELETMGRPLASTRAWILVVNRRASDPCNRIGRPFLGVGGVLVHADAGTVDHLDVAVVSL
jgi:hypothetical protein